MGFKWKRFVETLFDEALVSRAEIERVLSILMKDDRRRGSLRVTISRSCIRGLRRKFSGGQLSPSETCSVKEDAPRWKRFPVAFLEIVRSRKCSDVFILVQAHLSLDELEIERLHRLFAQSQCVRFNGGIRKIDIFIWYFHNVVRMHSIYNKYVSVTSIQIEKIVEYDLKSLFQHVKI